VSAASSLRMPGALYHELYAFACVCLPPAKSELAGLACACPGLLLYRIYSNMRVVIRPPIYTQLHALDPLLGPYRIGSKCR